MTRNILSTRCTAISMLVLAFLFDFSTLQAQDSNEKVRSKVEMMPEFPGGKEALFKYMMNNIQYPEDAKEKGVEGKVIVSFVVDKDGSITDVEPVTKVFPSMDAQALKVVSNMPKWTPGQQDGKKVRVQMKLPIAYKLPPKSN